MSVRRSLALGLAATALAGALAQPACGRQQPQAGAEERRAPSDRSAWEARVRAAQARLAAAPADVGLRRALAGLLLELGRAEEAERVATEGNGTELATALGEALYARGKVAEAEAAFRRAVTASASDAASARLDLAVLLDRRGDRAGAQALFRPLLERHSAGAARTAAELRAAGAAAAHLGATDPQLFHAAVRAYEEAIRLDPEDVQARLAEASLLLDKYSSTEAYDLIREALLRQPGHPGALVLLARAKQFDGSDEALALARRALAVAPDHVPALVFHARLLLGLEQYDSATAQARRALALNPASLEALAVLASARRLAGDERGFEQARDRALALDPRASTLFSTAAELAGEQRRYTEAAELARRAVAIDSTDWGGWTQLGMNQFRLGQVDSARRTLARAFAGDPYNIWVKNTLDLLDTYPQYVEQGGPRVRFFLHRDEADLLALYMTPLAEEAYDSLSRRYGYRPRGPIRMEVFPRHADFSVRTVGLTGLGALGVSFGEQLGMDSPAARKPGEFVWGSTLWHEMAHTFTLGLSRGRVPRWLTEGLSVLEERRARPGWGDPLTLSFARAWVRGDILPVSRLNEGFVRPKYPEQVIHSYYEASLVAEMIEQRAGADAIRRMLAAYGSGRDNTQVLADVLHATPQAFDAQFAAWVQQRFARELAAVAGQGEAPGMYLRQLAAARAALDGGRADEARRLLVQARDAFPEAAGPGSPYQLLAELAERAGDRAGAAAELERDFTIDGSDYQAMRKAAALRLALGDTARAAAALDRSMYVHPYDAESHRRLAELYTALRRHDLAVRERRALLALKPVDVAEARYQLALALERAGQREAARAEVMRALEAAPGYAAAQELLLRLSGGAP